MRTTVRATAGAVAAIALGVLPLAAVANEMIDAVMKKHRAAVADLKAAVGASKDAASAKANAAKVEAALKAETAAEDELMALMPKLDVKKDAAAYEKAMAEVQKSNQEISQMKLKVMENKDAAPEFNKAFKSK
jgi:hypothetical protein